MLSYIVGRVKLTGSNSTFGFSPEYKEYMLAQPIAPGRATLVGRTIVEGKVVHIADALKDPEYTWKESQLRGGYRTMLGVPLMREGAPIGVLSLTRNEVRPFTEKQIGHCRESCVRS